MNIKLATIHLVPLMILTAQYADAQPRITVEFVNPEKFTDVYPSSRHGTDRELKQTLDALRQLIVEAGNKSLGTGDELKMEILDVNLAGEYNPPMGGPANEVRIMRNIDWPSMKVHYTLKRGGKETQGDAVISDMSYLMSASTCPGGGALCYERRMVERWFRKDLH